MIDKISQKKSKKLCQISQTAETLFKLYGIKRVTVEEICKKANVSKMTFYKYFRNKIELVKHIFNSWSMRVLVKSIKSITRIFPLLRNYS